MENMQVIINQTPAEVTFNFEEMKEFLSDRVEEFKTATFTDDSIKSAKTVVAQLRKEQAAFKSRIIEVKKEFMLPFENFKKQADELTNLYDEPINFINNQVADYEQRRKKEKKLLIKNIYESIVIEYQDFISLEKIYNPKWENATFSKKAISEEIGQVYASTKTAIETICNMNSEAQEKALQSYKQNLSLTDAISYINNYEAQKAQILAREQEKKRKEEEERIRREERAKIEAEQRELQAREQARIKAEQEKLQAAEQAAEQAKTEVVEMLTPEFVGESNLYEYRISLTADAKEKLEMFMDSVGIEWELI